MNFVCNVSEDNVRDVPRMKLRLKPFAGKSFSQDILCDTGATRSIMSRSIANKFKLPINTGVKVLLKAANGAYIAVDGITELQVMQGMKVIHILEVAVSPVVSDFIVGCRDLRDMNILPSGFPRIMCNQNEEQVAEVKTIEGELRAELIDKYSDVFSDTLGVKPIKGPLMRIKLKPDADVIPRQCCVPRQVPIHFCAAAAALEEQLIERGVITPVHHPTEWISPAFL